MIDLCLVALPNPALSNPRMYFPLGILYLASIVKKEGFEVEITDMRDGEKSLPEAKFYGFSCTTPEIKRAKEVARKVTGKTIVGGAHASLMPNDCLDFDYAISGEGEQAIVDILKGEVKDKVILTDRIKDLDSIPYPAWDMADCFSPELFPGERYGKGELGMTVIGSRGCPFSCHFCGNVYRTPVIYRSSKNIVGELEELKKREVTHVRFEDDNFTLHPKFNDLCLEIGRLKLSWKAHTRSKLLTLDQAKLMKWAGCEEMGLGVESADDDVLIINNKQEEVSDHLRAIKILREAGIRSKTYFIAGLPGETDETLKINQAFFIAAKPDKWTLSTFTPYPGTEIYKHPDQFGIRILDTDFNNWWNFTESRFVHQLIYEPPEKTWQRYGILYTWLRREEWKKTNLLPLRRRLKTSSLMGR